MTLGLYAQPKKGPSEYVDSGVDCSKNDTLTYRKIRSVDFKSKIDEKERVSQCDRFLIATNSAILWHAPIHFLLKF